MARSRLLGLLVILYWSWSSTATSFPPSVLETSPDGTCGNGLTCKGSSWGQCCSQHGFCGDSEAYSQTGCNPAFGTCSSDEAPPPGTTKSGPAGLPPGSQPSKTVMYTSTQWKTSTFDVMNTITVTSTLVQTAVSVLRSTLFTTFTNTQVHDSTRVVTQPLTRTTVVASQTACPFQPPPGFPPPPAGFPPPGGFPPPLGGFPPPLPPGLCPCSSSSSPSSTRAV